MDGSHALRKEIVEQELRNWRSQSFVPFEKLRSLLTPSKIRLILQEGGIEKYQEEEAVEAVTSGGHRVFAVLNAMRQETSILLFRKSTDAFLSTTLDSGIPYNQQSLESILPDSHQDFYRIQWRFASPVFRRNLHDRVLSKNTILPFVRVEDVSSQGAFAQVRRVTIPGSHQQIVPDYSSSIVLVEKRLNLSNDVEEKFKHEQHILSMLGILKHPNIVEFHAAFTYEGRPTILFSEAECNLKEWLRGNRSVQLSQIETLEAIYGLCSALHCMHEYCLEGKQSPMVGCHFDIHPGNILVRGRSFILSDFGLSRLKYEIQGSQSYFKGGVRDYCAPECQQWDQGFRKYNSGRPSDVWSLACIIAEVATFLEHGLPGLHRFDDVRRVRGAVPTLRTFHDRGRPHQGVLSWIERLRSDALRSPIVTSLADIVNGVLVIDPRTRPNIGRVSIEIYHLLLEMRYRETAECLTGLMPSTDFGWKIELDRLNIWAKQLGLGPRFTPRDTEWFRESTSSIYFEKILHILLQIKNQGDDLLQHATEDSSDQHNGIQLHVLRVLINELWQTQTRETIERMNICLENEILSSEDTEVPEMAKFLPKGSRPQLLLAIKQAIIATNANMGVGESFQVDHTVLHQHQEWQQRLLGKARVPEDQDIYILTEFLQYDDSWIGRSQDLVSRINGLVSVMRKLHSDAGLPLLKCSNFCHCPDRQAYGLIYEIPRHFVVGSHIPRIINLTELIKKANARIKRPALGDVFALAHTLAASTASLHRAGWLHKGLSAYNIIFFPRNSDLPGDSLSTIRLIGFNYSRESDQGVITVGPREDRHVREYQHPEYRKLGSVTRFIEEFDCYSLGLILLELGRWSTLRDMIRVKDRKVLSPQDLRIRLLQEEVTQLKSSMGIDYQIAVEMCLMGYLPGTNDANARDTWVQWEQKIVRHLTRGLSLHSTTE